MYIIIKYIYNFVGNFVELKMFIYNFFRNELMCLGFSCFFFYFG